MTKIKFMFHPVMVDRRPFAVEKQEGELKRRYLEGVSSGTSEDGHGERMTENCIKSFQDQAGSGNILLYEGQHGVNFVDDIGKLVRAEIMPNGDWKTTYRLYDKADGMGPNTMEKVDKVWRQVNGLPPYVSPEGKPWPKQLGFSIEGEIPDGGILTMDDTGKRVMDNVLLDGTVLVGRPAYRTSIAHAVYKALGETPPWVVENNMKKHLRQAIDDEERKENYFRRRNQIDDALNDEIENIMSLGENTAERLDMLLDEYKALMIELITDSAEYFKSEATERSRSPVLKAKRSLHELFANLNEQVDLLKGAK